MSKEIFSSHIGSSSELTILGKIMPGFVPGRFPITYAARLRLHLRLLGALRRNGLEGRRAGIYTGPIDALRTLQFVRWTLIDNDTRLLLAVNFDRPLEPYVRRIVDIAGPLLDTILCNCEGFLGRSSDQGFHKFISFAMDNQAPVELFAASEPDVTADDADYFLQTDKLIRDWTIGNPDLEAKHASLKFKTPEKRLEDSAKTNPAALLDQGLNILQALYEYQQYYPTSDHEGRASRDDLLYYRLAQSLTPGFWRRLLVLVRKVYPHDPLPGIDEFDLDAAGINAINGHVENLIATGTTDVQLGAILGLLKRYREARSWFATPPEPRQLNHPAQRGRGTIQYGLIDSQPTRPNVACLLLFRVDDAQSGRSFLLQMKSRLWPQTLTGEIWNLSITHEGLKALQVDEEVRLRFPIAFREGMAERAGLLGDIDVNNPREWVWPKENWHLNGDVLERGADQPIRPETIDIIVQVAKEVDEATHLFDEHHPLFETVRTLATDADANSVTLLAVEPLQRKYVGGGKRSVGHIGFLDGISQPDFNGGSDYSVPNSKRGGEEEDDRTPLGDLLIGHAAKTDLNNSKAFAQRIQASNIKPYDSYSGSSLEDGTFQVIRKLRIDTAAFANMGNSLADREELIGRKKDGTPLDSAATDQQNFNYANDIEGKHTPLQSHIRRTNPREVDTPRILRRGWSYGPFDNENETFADADRGMVFIAYNANISEQFEVIQRWVSGGNSTGIASWHGDPLLAPIRPDGSRTFRYLKGSQVGQVKPPSIPPATLQWGLYAFTPSEQGLMSLAQGGDFGQIDSKATSSSVRRIDGLDAEASLEEWKLVLEDTDEENRSRREAIWREIRKNGGVLETKYGVLVGSASGVDQVLRNNDNAFSVRNYWDRMRSSVGTTYLGFDDPPIHTQSTNQADIDLNTEYHASVGPNDYRQARNLINPFFQHSEERLFDDVKKIARNLVNEIPVDKRYLPGSSGPVSDGRRVTSERFIFDLIARLCAHWFGLPNQSIDFGGPETENPHCPIDLIRGSFYVFWPHPTQHVAQSSRVRSKALLDAMLVFVTQGGAGQNGTLLKHLQSQSPRPTNEFIATSVVGACFGFAGPTSGSFRAVLYDWIRTGKLWRMQQRLRRLGAYNHSQVRVIMEQPVLDSLAVRVAADLLHRVTVKQTNLGAVSVDPGKRIVISLRSAAEDDPQRKRYFLFGGDYSSTQDALQPLHSCPGQRMALCTIMGALAALMSFDEIRPEGPLSIRVQ